MLFGCSLNAADDPSRDLRAAGDSGREVSAAAGIVTCCRRSVPVAAGDDLSYWRTPQGLVRLSPGLLSGVAFTGANRTVSPDQDDGILTAIEAQQLDLDGVELVVLSACETALGSAVSGEGLMGLQRAFQVAGSRTLVSTLWSVDDAATAMLVAEFYANLWERSLPRLEALRRAQVAVPTPHGQARNRRSVIEMESPARRDSVGVFDDAATG